MNTISSYINTFLNTGNFSNNLDEFGNVNLSVSGSSEDEIFISYLLSDNNYDTQQITKLYDVNITTIDSQNKQSSVPDLTDSYGAAVAENEILKSKLTNFVNSSDTSKMQAEVMAQKELIIKMRIQLGEGLTVDDFNQEFPYEKL